MDVEPPWSIASVAFVGLGLAGATGSAAGLAVDDPTPELPASEQVPCRDEHPLFVDRLEVRPVPGEVAEDTHVTEDGSGVYAHASDRLAFRVQLENHASGLCKGLSDAVERTDDLDLEATYAWGPADPGEEVAPDAKRSETHPVCLGGVEPQETCTTPWYELPAPGDRTVVGDLAGEHRLRLVVRDDTAGELAGAERVIVADRQPDLATTYVGWADRTTTPRTAGRRTRGPATPSST